MVRTYLSCCSEHCLEPGTGCQPQPCPCHTMSSVSKRTDDCNDKGLVIDSSLYPSVWSNGLDEALYSDQACLFLPSAGVKGMCHLCPVPLFRFRSAFFSSKWMVPRVLSFKSLHQSKHVLPETQPVTLLTLVQNTYYALEFVFIETRPYSPDWVKAPCVAWNTWLSASQCQNYRLLSKFEASLSYVRPCLREGERREI